MDSNSKMWITVGVVGIAAIYLLKDKIGKPIDDLGRVTGASADILTTAIKSPIIIGEGLDKLTTDLVAKDKEAGQKIKTIINKKSDVVDLTGTKLDIQKGLSTVNLKSKTSIGAPKDYLKRKESLVDTTKASKETATIVLQKSNLTPNPNIFISKQAPTAAEKTKSVLSVLGKTYF